MAFSPGDSVAAQVARVSVSAAVAQMPAEEVKPSPGRIGEYAGYATAIFLIGWGTGGLIFGILGDLIGRAKTMMITILLYSLFTGLSATFQGVRGLRVLSLLDRPGRRRRIRRGCFLRRGVDARPRARPFALGLLRETLSAVGNIMAAVAGIVLAYLARANVIGESWRVHVHRWRRAGLPRRLRFPEAQGAGALAAAATQYLAGAAAVLLRRIADQSPLERATP